MLDPNVLVSAAICGEGIPRRVLEAWRAGFFGMYASYELLHELEAVLMRPYFLDRFTYSDVFDYVRWIGEGAEVVELPPPGWEPERASADPDDDYLFDLALALGNAVLVSGDRHLLEIEDERVRIFSPKRFWDDVLLPLL